MTRKDIIRMAKEAGLLNYVDLETPRRYFIDGNADIEQVLEFAALIAAAEREACAEYVAQSFENELVSGKDSAAAIRARGE